MTVYSTMPPPPHRFFTDGGKQHLILELPSLDSLAGVDLDISTTEVRLLLPGSCEHLRIPLPLELAKAGAPAAKFSKKRKELTVTWDSVVIESSSPQAVAPIAEAAPAKVEASTVSPAPLAPERCKPPASLVETSKAPEKAKVVEASKCPASGPGAPAAAEAKDDGIECFEFLEDEIEDALKSCAMKKLKSIAALRGVAVLPSDFDIKGEACIKKKCCDFKASVSFRWEMMDAIGGYLGVSGTVEVPELSASQVAPKVIVKTSQRGSAQARAAGDWMKSQGSELISECLNGEKLSAQVFSAWDEADFDEPEAQPAPVLDEKALTQWAKTWLEQKMSNLNLKLFGGSASVSFVAEEVSGEVSISGTGSDAVADFNLCMDSSWTITTSVGKSHGSLSVKDFTPAHGSEGSAVTVESAPGKKVSGQLLTALRQTGVSAVRAILAQFMTDLQRQVKP